jgi:hypothetical protein
MVNGKSILKKLKDETVTILTVSISAVGGLFLAMIVLTWTYSLVNFKDILGTVIGGAFAVFSSLAVLLVQKEMEKSESLRSEREKLVSFFNYYNSILDFTFTQAKEHLKESDKLKMTKPDFDTSAMGGLREKSFELLGLRAGRLAQVIYYLLINIANKKNTVSELELEMKLNPKHGSAAIRDALAKDLTEQIEKIIKFEGAFKEIMEALRQKHRIGMSNSKPQEETMETTESTPA